MEKYDESIEDFLKSLELNSDNPVTYLNIGIVYRKMDRFKDAIEYFTREIELSEDRSKSFSYRAYCFVRLGAYD